MAFETLHDNRNMMQLAALAATERHHANPFRAEIVPNCRPEWHVIVTHPNGEGVAAGHLIGRGFGIYLPEFDRRRIVRATLRWQHLRMFPGYLLLFVWDIAMHWRRIEGCTGVQSVLQNGGVPIIVPDRIIDEIQQMEFRLLLNGPNSPVEAIPRYKKKGRKMVRDHEAEAKEVAGLATISPKSYWAELPDLDDSGRTQLFNRALGLACSAPS